MNSQKQFDAPEDTPDEVDEMMEGLLRIVRKEAKRRFTFLKRVLRKAGVLSLGVPSGITHEALHDTLVEARNGELCLNWVIDGWGLAFPTASFSLYLYWNTAGKEQSIDVKYSLEAGRWEIAYHAHSRARRRMPKEVKILLNSLQIDKTGKARLVGEKRAEQVIQQLCQFFLSNLQPPVS